MSNDTPLKSHLGFFVDHCAGERTRSRISLTSSAYANHQLEASHCYAWHLSLFESSREPSSWLASPTQKIALLFFVPGRGLEPPPVA